MSTEQVNDEPQPVITHPVKVLSIEPVKTSYQKNIEACSTIGGDEPSPMLFEEAELKAMEERLQASLLNKCETMIGISRKINYIDRENYPHSAFIGACLFQMIIENSQTTLSFLSIHIIQQKCMEAIEFPLRFTYHASLIGNIKNRIRKEFNCPALQGENIQEMLDAIDNIQDSLVELYEKIHHLTLL